MESTLYNIYSLVEAYKETYPFATFLRSFSDTSQIIIKDRTRTHSKSNLYISLMVDSEKPAKNHLEITQFILLTKSNAAGCKTK